MKKPIIIKNKTNLPKKIERIMSSNSYKIDNSQPFIIFNIYNTILDKQNNINKDIYCAIKYSIKNNNNVLFIEYNNDTKNITQISSLLRSFSLFKFIPLFFTMMKNKKLIIDEIYNQIKTNNKIKNKIIIIDNDSNYINDILKQNNKNIIGFNYFKYNSNNSLNNINESQINENKVNLYKLLKIKIKKKTKKQKLFNDKLQLNIKKNMSLFKKGKYKSKKQAIAIAYQETINNNNKNIKC